MANTPQQFEHFADQVMPFLEKRMESNDAFLKKLQKGTVNLEVFEDDKKTIKEDIQKEQDEIKAQIKVINESLATRKAFSEYEKDDGKFGFNSLGEFVVKQFEADALKKDGRRDSIDPRIVKVEEYKSKIQNDVLKAGTGPIAGDFTYGGALIPPGIGAPLVDQALKDTGLWDQMMSIPMSTPDIEFPTPENWDHSSGQYYGGIYATFQGEIDTINERRPKFGSIKLSLESAKLASAPSNKMILFSPVSVEAMLRQMMTVALAGLLADKAINGTGSGEPKGYITATPSSGGPGIQITRNTAAHIYSEDILAMDMAFKDNGRGVWLVNHNCKSEIRSLYIAMGNAGQPLYQYANGNQPFESLLNRKIIWTEYCQTLGTKGDIILIDPSQYIRGSLSTGPMFDTSPHVYFLTDQTTIKLVYYCDARPMWKTYLTPRYATTSYISPYVMLS
jgi:HK97 family phage major capsid protein